MTLGEPLTSYRGCAEEDNWQRTQLGWQVYLMKCYIIDVSGLPLLGDLGKCLQKDWYDGLIEISTNRQLLEGIVFLLLYTC